MVGEILLFQNIDFTLKASKWTCLLGPSGVGKTTLLRIIAGLSPDTDNVKTVCSDNNPLSGRTAYMAQQDLLLPWLNVIDNVLLGSRLRSEEADRSKAINLLEMVGLKNNMNDFPTTLSGGMRQRVALARTIMENRPIVLMDEPFSYLDAITRNNMQDLAAELLKNHTILLITHDPMEALKLGDRIHVLSGRPAILGPAIVPEGKKPRSTHDPYILEQQANLLDHLTIANQDNIK